MRKHLGIAGYITSSRIAGMLMIVLVACCCWPARGEDRASGGSGGSGEQATLIQDFEGNVEIGRWPDDGKTNISTNWASDGKHSLYIGKGTLASIEEMTTHDWSGYQVWRFHCHVPGKDAALLGIELADKGNGYLNRHQGSATAPPGDSVVEIDISGDLWRGEVNHPYRDIKTPLDKKVIQRFSITASSGDVYVDQVELVKVKALTTAGGFAFQFGPPNNIVQRDWISIHPETRWDETKGYGLSEGGTAYREFTPYPTPVMGGGITMNDAKFEVRLKAGAYVGWVIFERSGFWEESQASYRHESFSVNGKVIQSENADPAAAFFFLQDTEILDEDQLVNRLILPVQQVANIAFTAVEGKNSFGLVSDGLRPPRLAGLVIAPDTAEGRAFITAHKKAQDETIRKVHRLTGKQDRLGDPKMAVEPVMAVGLASDAVMHPGDWPAAGRAGVIAPMQGIGGMTSSRVVGLYAKSDVQMQVELSAFIGDGTAAGSTLPATAVRLQRNVYLPIRGYNETGCTIETHHYVPAEKTLRLTPVLARSLLVQVDVPAGTKAGVYNATLLLTCQGQGVQQTTVQAPISLVVHPGSLAGREMPVGLFFSGVAAPQPIISDEMYWKLTEETMRQMRIGNLTILTGGPNYSVTWNGDTPTYSGTGAVKLVHLGQRYGLDLKVVEYGGFGFGFARELPPAHGKLTVEETVTAMGTAWNAFRLKNILPEHYVYAYDEPTTPSDFDGVEARLTILRKAGFKTCGYTSVEDPTKVDAQHAMLAKLTYAPALGEYSPETLKWVRGLGNEPWIYGGDLSRQSFGVDLWRAQGFGAVGRLGWIGSIVQGFQYDTLDGREPDPSCFYIHSTLGVLIAPRFLGVVEGGIDRRLLFEMGRRAGGSGPGAAEAKAIVEEVRGKPFREAMGWEELEALRVKMFKVLDEGAR